MLAQIVNSGAADSTLVGEGAAQSTVSLLDLLMEGGFMMIPLILLSILAIYVFVERLMSLKGMGKLPKQFSEKVKGLVKDGDIKAAIMYCDDNDTPAARMIAKGLRKIGTPLKNIEAAIENVGKIEVYRLEKNLPLMATISGAAPMIGFLGTVTGMINAFIAIAQEEGSVSPKLLSTGIYEAMVTTATGLLVGIVAYLGYNYLVAKVQKIVHTMEYNAVEFIDLLQEPNKS